ncbi:hypothetical protein U1Q18_027759 [Sarracenia purpurea var. burkii]
MSLPLATLICLDLIYDGAEEDSDEEEAAEEDDLGDEVPAENRTEKGGGAKQVSSSDVEKSEGDNDESGVMNHIGFVDTEDMNVVSGKRKFTSLVGYSSSKLAQVDMDTEDGDSARTPPVLEGKNSEATVLPV